MKTVYFIFSNMRDADYYYKTLKYYLQNEYDIKAFRTPLKIITPRFKKLNIIEKIFGRKENTLEIMFRSKKSNLIGIHKGIYYFDDGKDYDFCSFMNVLKEI